MNRTARTYSVRPAGASRWSGPGLSAAQALRDHQEAQAALSLSTVVLIVCDQDGSSVAPADLADKARS